ncbi:hypothetical protein A0H81_14959 [Grifola frondosa]|uniref:Uncharacterized protein n=1 Tax=Grifola frondosa TaxID=5627 RepID=A0A1C7LQK8_GRIFR|nr:hypothetical protein A0H81_14959 [Grifola frondosa]
MRAFKRPEGPPTEEGRLRILAELSPILAASACEEALRENEKLAPTPCCPTTFSPASSAAAAINGSLVNGSPASSSNSPAELASLLATSLREAESLKRELSSAKRRSEKAERLLAALTQSNTANHSPSNPSPPGSSSGNSQNASSSQPQPQFPEAAMKVILDCEARIERAEQARDEADARLRLVQEAWIELDRYLTASVVRSTDARTAFSRLVADGGGPLLVLSSSSHPVQNSTQSLPSMQLPPLPHSHAPLSVRTSSILSHKSSLPHSFPILPPPPSAHVSSRVVLPPKKFRSDRDRDREHDLIDRGRERRYSVSPSNSPNPTYLSNGASDRSPPFALHHSSNMSTLHPHYLSHSHPFRPRMRDGDLTPPFTLASPRPFDFPRSVVVFTQYFPKSR